MAKHEEQLGVVPALVRSTFLVNAVYAESAREYGLTSQQGQLLCVLMAQPYGMSELGAMLRLAKSSLTELVDRTAQRGMVRREPNPKDRRAVQVKLTEQGAKLADEFYTETCRRIDELPSGLDETERATLADLLSRLVRDNNAPTVFIERNDAP
ncbi:MarR family winged helix-turn-helix transcriptional regulator [Nonomuraea spiralis]|uniref:MarR family winged helix-turn-helix transcriptional regulator n=1 Tax=Nonomuraea spiralis TaxID=46182 RepID=A0ABV5IQF0_9ACTN|nr:MULTISPECIES: MarR family transcriptional regulator [Nonomuraea]RSM96175.1 MarR family transcriptional regulator [Nonomuraea sp. WAC 01424]GGT26699.1 MarR family transcriptional regulator [Nonomuraea spiralis]